MILSFSHDAMIVRQQDALAEVKRLDIYGPRIHAPATVTPPANAVSVASVAEVLTARNAAEVTQSVVCAVMVDVVNVIRLLAVGHKPGDPMSLIPFAVKPDSNVSVIGHAASNSPGAGFSADVSRPGKHARFGIVIKNIVNGIWDNLYSHLKLPLDLVRGSVVGATDAPILYQIPNKMNIGGLNG